MTAETKTRTAVRMVTYRLSAWLLTIPITYWFTGSLRDALGSSTLLHIVLSIDYFVHERIWLKVKWGLRTASGPASGDCSRSI
jgi:adenylylsulfate kinase